MGVEVTVTVGVSVEVEKGVEVVVMVGVGVAVAGGTGTTGFDRGHPDAINPTRIMTQRNPAKKMDLEGRGFMGLRKDGVPKV